MSCHETETTTLLWLYGELDAEQADAHLHHIAACADCSAAVAEHEQVAVAVAPIAPALRQVESVRDAPAPANRPFFAAAFVFVAAAAAALIVTLMPGSQPAAPLDTDVAVVMDTDIGLVTPALFGDVDGDLQELEWELADLSYDLGTL